MNLLKTIRNLFSNSVVEYAKHLQEMDRIKREHEERLAYMKWKAYRDNKIRGDK